MCPLAPQYCRNGSVNNLMTSRALTSKAGSEFNGASIPTQFDRFSVTRSQIEGICNRERETGVKSDFQTIALLHGAPTRQAAILGHGLGQPTLEMRSLAESLHSKGLNVVVPRAPLHGFHPDGPHIRHLTSRRLVEFTTDWLRIGEELGSELITTGVSLGGTIALNRCLSHSKVLQTVVAAPSFGFQGIRDTFRPLVLQALSLLPDSKNLPLLNVRVPGGSTRAISAAGGFTLTTERLPPVPREVRPTCTFVLDPEDEMMKMSSVRILADRLEQVGVTVRMAEIDYLHSSYHDRAGSQSGCCQELMDRLGRDIEAQLALHPH